MAWTVIGLTAYEEEREMPDLRIVANRAPEGQKPIQIINKRMDGPGKAWYITKEQAEKFISQMEEALEWLESTSTVKYFDIDG